MILSNLYFRNSGVTGHKICFMLINIVGKGAKIELNKREAKLKQEIGALVAVEREKMKDRGIEKTTKEVIEFLARDGFLFKSKQNRSKIEFRRLKSEIMKIREERSKMEAGKQRIISAKKEKRERKELAEGIKRVKEVMREYEKSEAICGKQKTSELKENIEQVHEGSESCFALLCERLSSCFGCCVSANVIEPKPLTLNKSLER